MSAGLTVLPLPSSSVLLLTVPGSEDAETDKDIQKQRWDKTVEQQPLPPSRGLCLLSLVF